MCPSEVGAAVLVALALSAGCDDGVDIIGECTLEDVRRVTEEPALPSVGLLDGRVFVSVAAEVPAEDPTVRRSEWEGLWLDGDLEPASERLWLGSGLIGAVRTRWLRHGDALVAHIWSRPDPPPPWSEDRISLWTVTPPPRATAEALPIRIEVPPPDDDPAIGALSLGFLHHPDGELVFPAAEAAGTVVGAVAAIPPACNERLASNLRLHAFALNRTDAFPVTWAEQCGDRDLIIEAPWLFSNADGGLSMLYRAGSDGPLRLLRLDEDLSIRDGPRRVGGTHVTTTDDGFQPRAVAVPGGKVLFFERISSNNCCHVLRIMNADGTCAEDAPWQLPCMRDGPFRGCGRDIITGYLELVRVPGGAVVVWGEHTNPHELWVTADIDYREGIYAALLTPEGRRGSAVVEITDEEATFLDPVPRTETLGPYPVKPRPSVAAEGDSLVVAWPDRRADAPGVYVRRLTCTVHGD